MRTTPLCCMYQLQSFFNIAVMVNAYLGTEKRLAAN